MSPCVCVCASTVRAGNCVFEGPLGERVVALAFLCGYIGTLEGRPSFAIRPIPRQKSLAIRLRYRYVFFRMPLPIAVGISEYPCMGVVTFTKCSRNVILCLTMCATVRVCRVHLILRLKRFAFGKNGLFLIIGLGRGKAEIYDARNAIIIM